MGKWLAELCRGLVHEIKSSQPRCYHPRRCCARRGTNSSFPGRCRFCEGPDTLNSGLAESRCYRPRRCCARRGNNSSFTGRRRFRGGPATFNSGLAESRCYRPRRYCARRGNTTSFTGHCCVCGGPPTSARCPPRFGSDLPLSTYSSYAIPRSAVVVPCPPSSPPSTARSSTSCHI